MWSLIVTTLKSIIDVWYKREENKKHRFESALKEIELREKTDLIKQPSDDEVKKYNPTYQAISRKEEAHAEWLRSFERQRQIEIWHQERLRQIEKQKDKNLDNKGGAPCFIATATFGSPMASEVIRFRQFRDEILLNSKVGIIFVKLYYRVSPPFALLITKFQILKLITRELLLNPILRLLQYNETKSND